MCKAIVSFVIKEILWLINVNGYFREDQCKEKICKRKNNIFLMYEYNLHINELSGLVELGFVLIINNKILIVEGEIAKESKMTTGEWNERKAKEETKLRSFLVLDVGGGC